VALTTNLILIAGIVAFVFPETRILIGIGAVGYLALCLVFAIWGFIKPFIIAFRGDLGKEEAKAQQWLSDHGITEEEVDHMMSHGFRHAIKYAQFISKQKRPPLNH
jgi:hypothetical protein